MVASEGRGWVPWGCAIGWRNGGGRGLRGREAEHGRERDKCELAVSAGGFGDGYESTQEAVGNAVERCCAREMWWNGDESAEGGKKLRGTGAESGCGLIEMA